MNIREAILKSAEQIERNPAIFDFWEIRVPPCGSPGCAIGLIGSNLGFVGAYVRQSCGSILGVISDVFYGRMRETERQVDPLKCWMSDALHAAKTLRLYADKYHPAQEMPAEVRAIFDMTPGELAEALSAA